MGADLAVLAVFHGPAAAGRHPRGQPAGGAHPQEPPGRAGPAEPRPPPAARPPPEPRRRGPYTGSRLGDNFAEDTQVNPPGSPTVIAESPLREGTALVRSPRQHSSVASSPRPGARGSARPAPGSPSARPLARLPARPRSPRLPGRASALARRPPSTAPRGDTRRRPRRRLPREPLLRRGQVGSTPSSGSGSSQERALATGRPRAAPATPPRGGDNHARFSVRSLSARAGAPLAPRTGVAAPGSLVESAAPARGCAGRGRRRLAGRAARAPLLPPTRRKRPRREEGRGDTAQTLVCKAQPGARAALRVGPPPPGRVGGGPAPHPRLLLLLLLLLAREARAPAQRDSSPSPLGRAPWAVEGAGLPVASPK